MVDRNASPIISGRCITKRYDGVLALDDVSLDVYPGQVQAIVGENGAGKSTLMKILAGVVCDYEGTYLLRGQPIRFAGTRDAEAAGVSIIHQELNLVEQLSAAANVFLGREKTTRVGLLDSRAMNDAAAALLEGLECRIDPRRLAGELRVGDQQLLEIAKALSLSADVLVMDEPTSALTETEVARLFRVVNRLRDQGVAILYISHKMDEVFEIADVVTVLRDGRLVDSSSKDQTSPHETTHRMVGREIENARGNVDHAPGEVVLEVESLRLPWPGHARRWRLDDVSFSLRRGEILGVAGLMGAGRTELLESLFGASEEEPQGVIRLEGRPVRFRNPAEAVAAGMAMATEDRKRTGLFAQMTVRENMTLCSLGETSVGGWIRSKEESAAAQATVERLNLKTASLEAPITSLSGGNQQKAILGRWLLARPKVLLLDDPTRGVDVGAKAEFYRLVEQLCRDGLSVVVTSSELPELLALCDRILVLCEGRLTGQFDRAETTEAAIMEAATRVGS